MPASRRGGVVRFPQERLLAGLERQGAARSTAVSAGSAQIGSGVAQCPDLAATRV
jgi:hypothetical protein